MCCFVLGRGQSSPQAGLAGPGPAGYSVARPVRSTLGHQEGQVLTPQLPLVSFTHLEEIM